MAKIVFDRSARNDILRAFGKTVDQEGYIVETSAPNHRVLSFDGEEVLATDLGGIRKGSELYLKNNVASLMRYIKLKR